MSLLHACMHAADLWDVMARVWPIPGKELVIDSGKDWLLLLADCSDVVCSMIIMMIWRIWQVRCDITHGKEAAPIVASAYFLVNYMNSVQSAKKYSIKEMLKGKMVVMDYGEGPNS